MLRPKVRQVPETMNPIFVKEGKPTYQALNEALEDASRLCDVNAIASLSLDMATRLHAIAMISRANTASSRPQPDWMPDERDLTEPAFDLFEQSLDNALIANNSDLEMYAHDGLACCYIHGKYFLEALEHLERVVEKCKMPEDFQLCYRAHNTAGDCHLELRDDEAALRSYEAAMSVAREVDDPIQISIQLGNIASVLRNLKRYRDAMIAGTQSRDLLIRVRDDSSLERKIVLHKHLFSVSGLHRVITSQDERLADIERAIGEDLLRELPKKLAAAGISALCNFEQPSHLDWPVFRELDQAVRAATLILAPLIKKGNPSVGVEPIQSSTASAITLAGSLAHQYFGPEIGHPKDLVTAARYLLQIERCRRAAAQAAKSEKSEAGPGPAGSRSTHIVYLRSFVANSRLPQVNLEPWGRLDLEELLACMLDRSPLIALGDADLERFGPGVFRTSDTNWNHALKALAMDARMLLVVPAATAGTSWEIDWVVTNKFLHKTCFVMPPAGLGQQEWWVENWRQLRNWSVRLGLNWPEYDPPCCLFRLTSEGLIDRIEFSEIYTANDLDATLMGGLLFKPNLSFDFLYAAQLEVERTSSKVDSQQFLEERIRATGADATPPALLRALLEIDSAPRLELSDWHYEAGRVPKAAGVVMLYEGPSRLLWVESSDNIRDHLDRYTQGKASDFTRLFFKRRVLTLLTPRAVSQVLENSLNIESIVSFRVRQMVSYRFLVLPDREPRTSLVDLVWKGASKFGVPELPGRDQASGTG